VSAAPDIYGGALGFGLEVVASDFDGDGCLDLYVANDFRKMTSRITTTCGAHVHGSGRNGDAAYQPFVDGRRRDRRFQ
jgi:hypothetical protein